MTSTRQATTILPQGDLAIWIVRRDAPVERVARGPYLEPIIVRPDARLDEVVRVMLGNMPLARG